MMLGALSAGETTYLSLVVDSVSATAGPLNTCYFCAHWSFEVADSNVN